MIWGLAILAVVLVIGFVVGVLEALKDYFNRSKDPAYWIKSDRELEKRLYSMHLERQDQLGQPNTRKP